MSRLTRADRAWVGGTDRDLGVVGVGELKHGGVTGLGRPHAAGRAAMHLIEQDFPRGIDGIPLRRVRSA
jgi:hypothetical protein